MTGFELILPFLRPLEQHCHLPGVSNMSEIPRIPPRNTIDYESRFEPLLASDEAAALLKIHPKTLQRMARRGEPSHAVAVAGEFHRRWGAGHAAQRQQT